MNTHGIVLLLTYDPARTALKQAVVSWKPINMNPSCKMYVITTHVCKFKYVNFRMYFPNCFVSFLLFFLSGTMAPDYDDSEDQCKICMDNGIDCVLLECGHMVTCTNCGKQISDCPICRQHISRIVHVFKA